jgi:hypothetical protein
MATARRPSPWANAPAWAADLLEINLIVLSQNESILAVMENRESRLTAVDQAKVDSIFEVAGTIKSKIDEAQK